MKNQDTDSQLECLSNQRQIDTEFNSIPSGYKKGPLWISVKERLPEDDFNCIITNKYGRGVDIAYYVKEDKLWLLAYSGEIVHGVTHWMKMPEII